MCIESTKTDGKTRSGVLLTLALGAALAAFVALAGTAREAQAAFPGCNGKIVFDSGWDGNLEVYATEVDGSDQIDLTNNGATDVDPDWRVAYS